jgi:hypothetical protein
VSIEIKNSKQGELKLFTILLGGAGVWLGSHVGIAAFGTAIAGTIPLGLLGASAGLLADIATGK